MGELYGARFFDILLLDSLYAQAPVLGMLDRLGWDAVITFKQERRDLYQEQTDRRRCALRSADS
jgi:hypothetical protein